MDTPLLLVAFSAGVVAALGSALLPYLTGQIIDYAAIEPDRCGGVAVGEGVGEGVASMID